MFMFIIVEVDVIEIAMYVTYYSRWCQYSFFPVQFLRA